MEFTLSELTAFATVVFTDVALAGDNAIVVGMAAAGLPLVQRKKAILIGIIGATVLRILFALVTTELLKVIGLMLAGGVLLLWVSWKLWREIRSGGHDEDEGERALDDENLPVRSEKSFREAVTQIIVADVSMSLDNVLAVAGAARDHTAILIFGLALSVALMGLGATFVARLLQRYHWIAYVGLGVILYIAVTMIWDGGQQVLHEVSLMAPVAG